MNEKNPKARSLAIVFTFSLVALLVTGNSTAEEMPDSEYQMLTNGGEFSGTVNSVNAEQGIVVIDDRSFVLDRIVQFNGGTWSREQVLKRLQTGDSVEMEVGQIVDPSRGARLIKSLSIANK
ncbi:MAG: hypothetical protein ACPG9R_14340 [Marinobacter salsuginis]